MPFALQPDLSIEGVKKAGQRFVGVFEQSLKHWLGSSKLKRQRRHLSASVTQI
jgi:hypothetical protein